ncbi:unnamed protein product, partial [Nesidiocoris tenuis]
ARAARGVQGGAESSTFLESWKKTAGKRIAHAKVTSFEDYLDTVIIIGLPIIGHKLAQGVGRMATSTGHARRKRAIHGAYSRRLQRAGHRRPLSQDPRQRRPPDEGRPRFFVLGPRLVQFQVPCGQTFRRDC